MGNLKKWLFLGLFFRILIMPFTGHWDLTSLHTVADAFLRHGSIVYSWYYYSIYPPLTYLTLGLWQKFVGLLVGQNISSWVTLTMRQVFSDPNVFRYFTALKILYLPFDIAIGFLLVKLVPPEKKETVFKFWMLNPIVIYIVYMWSSIDIIPTFFLLLSAYLLTVKKPYLSFAFLGIGAAFKIFPLIFLPIFIAFGLKKTKVRIIGILTGLLPLIITIVPFVNRSLLKNIFLSSSSQALTSSSFYLGGNISLSIFLIIYSIILYVSFQQKYEDKNKIMFFLFSLFMVFYSFSNFTPQWFIWGLPYIIFMAALLPENKIFVKIIFYLYLLIVMLFEVTLNIGLFGPIDFSILSWPSLGDIVNRFMELNKIVGLVRSIFAGTALYLIFRIFKTYENKN